MSVGTLLIHDLKRGRDDALQRNGWPNRRTPSRCRTRLGRTRFCHGTSHFLDQHHDSDAVAEITVADRKKRVTVPQDRVQVKVDESLIGVAPVTQYEKPSRASAAFWFLSRIP
ncbi:hypothetical protein [Streptomyces griseorubiginosus]|uniref:hypothetical protein n=1 Tax=Streptomyces griseorubiginosus TaxID=67304 RepID=UPI0031FD14A9